MTRLPVRVRQTAASVTFPLRPFIFDWERAKRIFVSGMVSDVMRGFETKARDFTVSPMADPGESWCRYRIAGGPNMAILRPESLQFDFPNLIGMDYELETGIVQRAMESLLPALGSWEEHSYFLAYDRHVDVIGSAPKTYLSQFSSDEMEKEAGRNRSEFDIAPPMRYWPSARFVLRSDDGRRVLRRQVEQSELLSSGLFITTLIYASMLERPDFDYERRWFDHIAEIADRAVGIEYRTDEPQ